MDEWVDHVTCKCIKLDLETSFVVGGDQSQWLLVFSARLFVRILILVEEGGELFIVSHLLFFHGYD